MSLTAGTKFATTIVTGILVAGFVVIFRSTAQDNVTGGIGGACLVMMSLVGLLLIFLRHWVTNTNEERRTLRTAQREAQAERVRYVALQAANESEHGRVLRDVAATRATVKATLETERRQMQAEFDGTRATELAKAFQTGVEMERSGALCRDKQQRGNLIRFPDQTAAPTGDHSRPREHGSVGP